jgi:hypothetical protein
MDLLPRPTGTTPVRCPSCGHPLDEHVLDSSYGATITGCCNIQPSSTAVCACAWTPNDIAWATLHGELTNRG